MREAHAMSRQEVVRPFEPKRLIKQSGAESLLLRMARNLRSQGDNSARIYRDRKPWYSYKLPPHAELMLCWSLRSAPWEGQGKGSPSGLESKGVKVTVYNPEEINVVVTIQGEGWMSLEKCEEYQQRARQGELSLTERIALAFGIAGYCPDYRNDESFRSSYYEVRASL